MKRALLFFALMAGILSVVHALCFDVDNYAITVYVQTNFPHTSLDPIDFGNHMMIPKILTELSEEFYAEYGLRFALRPFGNSFYGCPGYKHLINAVRLVSSSNDECITSLDQFDEENAHNDDPGFNFPIPWNYTLDQLIGRLKEMIITRYDLDRIKRGDCKSVVADKFLSRHSAFLRNGLREKDEICDSIISHDQLPCNRGKLKTNWQIKYVCPEHNNLPCSAQERSLICQRDEEDFPSQYCTTFIDYIPPGNTRTKVCYDLNCDRDRYAWGVMVPGYQRTPSSTPKDTFFRHDDIIQPKYKDIYGCFLPDRTKIPVCYDSSVIKRPKELEIQCAARLRVELGEGKLGYQWTLVDDEYCQHAPKPTNDCSREDVLFHYELEADQLPSCLGYLCAPDKAYETKDYEKYKSCSSDQTHGLSIASCEVNRGRITRHVGCYYIDQTDLETFPVYKEDTENTLCEALGEPPLDLYVSHCQYHWECPVNPEQPGPIPEPCEFCATQSCFDTVITTQPVCVWRWDGAYGKLDVATGEEWCSSDGQLPYEPPAVPKPPVKGHDCGELCIPMWGCFDSIEQEYVPCDSFNHDPYPCVPADEEAQCGAGVRKEGSISTTCMGLRSYGTHTPYEYFDTDEPCDGIALPAFECIVECETTWVCSTYAINEGGTADGPTEGTQVEEIKSCTLASIKSSLNALSQCGTTQYYTTISCPDGITCDDRPPDFPSGTDRVSFSIDHAVTCGATCFDANKDTLQEGDDLDLNIHSRACDEWGVPLRKYDAEHLSTSDYTCAASGPCQEGVLRRGILCYDRITNKIVRVGTKDGDHGSPTFCRAVFERFHQQSFLSAWCTTYDPAVCATEHRCAFDYLEQFSPTGESINSVQPFASGYHSFHSDNCNISSWDPILDEYYAGLDDGDDADEDQDTKQRGLCGQMAQVDRCFIKPKTGGEGQGTWFPDIRLCANPTLFSESSAVYALNKSDDETFKAYRSTSYGQQAHHLNHFFMEGCARWRCSRTLDGNPTSTSYSTNYCYDDELICNLDPPAMQWDRCGSFTFHIGRSCFYPNLVGEHGQQRSTAPLSLEQCRFLDLPRATTQCLYLDECDSIRKECGFVSRSSPIPNYSQATCHDACKTPLCGESQLVSVCFANTRTATNGMPSRFEVHEEHCIHPDDTNLPSMCENHLACTHWVCGDWTSQINHSDHLQSDTSHPVIPIETMSRKQCTVMPSESVKRSFCSVPCGRGTLQRHVACVSNGKVLHADMSQSRCGLHYLPPMQTLACEVNPSNCGVSHECNMSHLAVSGRLCQWASSPDSCPSVCPAVPQTSHDGDGKYPIDTVSRCVYRGAHSFIFAPADQCAVDSQPTAPKNCQFNDKACRSDPIQTADQPFHLHQLHQLQGQQCAASTPNGSPILSDFRVGYRSILIPKSDPHANETQQQQQQQPQQQQFVMRITLDDPYTPVQWLYTGPPGVNSLTLYLQHPSLSFPYLIDTLPINAVNSFNYHPVVMIPGDVIPPFIYAKTGSLDSEVGHLDNLEPHHTSSNSSSSENSNTSPGEQMHPSQAHPNDPSLYPSILAYISPDLYQTLQFIELLPPSNRVTIANPPLSGVGSGYTAQYCNNQPCYNGICTASSDSDASDTCRCLHGFAGRFCERYTLCVASTTCPPNAVAVPRQDDLSREWAYSPQDLPVSASPATPQEYDAILATLSPPSTQCDQCQCIHQFFGENCDECGLMCSPSRGVPNAQCSACDCQEGFLGPQCNCRRVFLPIYHHRAPAFLERYFATAKRSSGRSSPATIAEAPTSIRREYTQWKRIVLNDVSLDLSYPVTSLDIADYGYHSSGGTTLFLVLVAVNTCENIPQRASAHTTLDTTDEEQLSYRAGNTTDLALASILLSEYTKPYENQEPTPPPSFLSIKPQSLGVFDIKEDQGEWEEDEGNTTSTSSSVVAIGKIFEPLADHLSRWQSLASEPPAAVVDQAHRTLSAPLILQAVYHTPSHIATGVSHAMGSGFVRVGRVIDPYCETTGQPVCYSTSEMPRLKKMPYGPASKRAPPVTLILILVFCVALPLIVLLLVILFCWWKSIYLFKPRESKEDESQGGSAHSKTSHSDAEMTDYTAKRGNTRSKQGTYSMTTASTPHQLEDPDLHPDWKKVMGPAGEPIYINDTTLKSSKVRPLADGTIPSQKSMFHRPTIFTKKST